MLRWLLGVAPDRAIRETIASRRIAVLLSGFGFGHIRRYVSFRPHPQRLALHPFCKV